MTEFEDQPELSPTEQAVLEALTRSDGPLDAIGVASATRLGVDVVLKTLDSLADRKLVSKRDPEPVHERFATAGATR